MSFFTGGSIVLDQPALPDWLQFADRGVDELIFAVGDGDVAVGRGFANDGEALRFGELGVFGGDASLKLLSPWTA